VDESRNGLIALRHALENLVAPAIDPADPIAREQLVSGVRYLDFVIERIDLIHQRERYELRHTHRLAADIVAHPDASNVEELAALLPDAVDRLNDPNVPTEDIRTLTAALRAAIRATYILGDDRRNFAAAAVLEAASEYCEFERAWYAPMGFDTEEGEPEPLSSFLAASADPLIHGSHAS
jgi:hypothetical protein